MLARTTSESFEVVAALAVLEPVVAMAVPEPVAAMAVPEPVAAMAVLEPSELEAEAAMSSAAATQGCKPSPCRRLPEAPIRGQLSCTYAVPTHLAGEQQHCNPCDSESPSSADK